MVAAGSCRAAGPFVGRRVATYRLGNVSKRRASIVLFIATAGIVWFSRGFGLVESVALLVCGLAAGGALAALAAARQKAR